MCLTIGAGRRQTVEGGNLGFRVQRSGCRRLQRNTCLLAVTNANISFNATCVAGARLESVTVSWRKAALGRSHPRDRLNKDERTFVLFALRVLFPRGAFSRTRSG